MNPNITNTMNQTLFTARVTGEVPPKLSVVFHEGSRLHICGNQGPFPVEDTHQCEIGLRDRKPDLVKAVSLDSDHECGTFLSCKEVRQNAYECKIEGTTLIKENLSHVTLKVRNAKLIVGFRTTPAPAATPANSNSDIFAFLNQPKPASTTTPPTPIVSKWANPAPAQPLAPPPAFNPGC